jgi:hypothetical protein
MQALLLLSPSSSLFPGLFMTQRSAQKLRLSWQGVMFLADAGPAPVKSASVRPARAADQPMDCRTSAVVERLSIFILLNVSSIFPAPNAPSAIE